MLTVNFYEKNGKYVGFKVDGHADYAESGQDIVCASVSSAVQLTSNLITQNFGINARVGVDKKTNAVTLRVAEIRDEADKILRGFKQHLELVSHEFENTINIYISEV
ncbi:MAG: ribosomal-processing cysteine protease Prp [Oscillospiraceae bacterium]|nr:ribosomal-processing cysteine protease Prp [Oscillospiraceae bacterium]